MTKLLTLNDILHKKGIDLEENNWGEISPFDLREEAIKWCKADKSNFYSKEGKEEIILWIKNFFNITDEEIKESSNLS